MREDDATSARWVCDYCGYCGYCGYLDRSDDDRRVDQVQCPMCGEPVTPLR